MYNNQTTALDDDGDIQAKKDLLQKEIIDRNFNKEQFIDFCSVKKNNGDDLSRWTLSELKEVVNEFVKYHEEENAKLEAKQKMLLESQQRAKEIEVDIERLKQQNMKQQGESATKVIICKKLEKSQLNDKQVNVEVRNPKAIETSLFKSNYITYEVFTDVTGWLVR